MMIFVLLFAYLPAFFELAEAGLLPRLFFKQSLSSRYADHPTSSSKNATLHLQTRQDDARHVYMHHIVGNTYDYTVNDWRSDIQQIGSGGVDAIALNFGSDSWQNEQLRNAYSAASGTGVKVFLSFDFTSFPCDINSVVNVVNQFANDRSQFKINGRPLISSYEGKCLGNNGWQEIKDRTGGYLMPFVSGIEDQFRSWSCLDSWFCWGCAWPQGNADKNTADDQYYLQQLGSSIKYVTSVSPWMFTHYDYKNFYQRGDDWLIASRWEQLIGMRDRVPMVEMVTWNDFGESDYFSDIKGLQPSGTTWADGYSHLPFFELSKYYITAYKTGNYPPITDVIYFWARPHPAQAIALADSLARPLGFNFAEDSLWALVFATQPGEVTLTCGSSTQQFKVATGVNKLKIPLSPGKITVSMTRNGKTFISKTPSDFTYNAVPRFYNYNVYVGSAKSDLRAPIPTNSPQSTPTSATVTRPSVTTPTPVPTSTGESWNFFGCVEEGTRDSRRALTGASFSRSDMTPELCQSLCVGYSFAGVEYGQECYCGNSLINNGASGNPTSSYMCSVPCAGDSSKNCGGGWTLSVYTSFSKTPPSPQPDSYNGWKSLGCYADSPSRFLKGSIINRGGMTTTMCINECSNRGYIYAATEYGVECYCGNGIEKTSDGAGVGVDDKECNMTCDGDSSAKCGGAWRASVYSVSTLGSRSWVSWRHHIARKKRYL